MTALAVDGASVSSSIVDELISPLSDVSLHADAGEIVAVLSVDGASSTLLRAICGLVRLDAGSILLGGRTVTTASARARARLGLATALPTRPVSETLTVGENLRVAGATRRQLTHWVASWFPDLLPMLGRRAGLLSGGEQTLLALARTMVQAPRVLLAEDISAGLAPHYLDLVEHVLSRAASELGTAVVLAEQTADMVGVADQVAALSHGRLVFTGTPSELRTRTDWTLQ